MAAKGKTKAPALNVPQTDEEANELLRLYGETGRRVASLELCMQAKLDQVKIDYEDESAPFKRSLNDLFERLQAYAEANRARLTGDGKVKTVELPAGRIAWRIRPPSIKLTQKLEDVIERLRAGGMKKFLRVKYELNKEAMLEEPMRAACIGGIRVIRDVEDFVVEPFGPELARKSPPAPGEREPRP